MKNKIKLTLLPLQNSTIYIVCSIVIIAILMVASYQVLSLFSSDVGVYKKLSSTELFIQGGSDKIDYSSFEQIFPFIEVEEQLGCQEGSIGIANNEFDNTLDISETLHEQLEDETYSQQIIVCPNNTSKQVQKYHLPNEAYGFDSILYGDYPGQGEVLIGEYVANLYASNHDYKNYKDIIGQKINVTVDKSDYEFKISGVIEGTSLILYDNPKAESLNVDNPDYYKDFETKASKEQFITDNNLNKKVTNITYYDSDNYNYTNPKSIVIAISLLLELITLVVVLIYPLKQIKYIIRFYKHQKQWYLIYSIPILIIFIILVINSSLYHIYVK